ncbi:3-dehydroquinate synthase [Epidermidibacterium keratini]|uniref:3-dehydroquinate synthase n=1 Tax=Epidermidibacterium keratini TaxID=1891644 RepID=A0A7L4YJF2_9ACTN|nr:3-dehydroquinate synthase [Epidermidibacterium keratini]QHB99042.1 3-dehydroquinate synthase [Epidermidibacterium keratini]
MSAVVPVAGATPYDVVVGDGVLDALPGMITGADRVAVMYAEPVAVYADSVARELAQAGFAVTTMEVPDAEAGKRLEVAGACWDALGAAGFTRNDAVVAVGGGAVTDLGGWVAAAWLRGVRVVHVPTTLLGMVDAAVGGKTAINTDAGKNLVGAFHPPAGVLCELSTLSTLPQADYVAGLAEVIKAGFIADPVILDLIESDLSAATHPSGPHTAELVQRAIAVKARVVGEDLTEQGLREILNYGHTLGHAIEKAEDYRWRHGDAVAVGMLFAAQLGARAGSLDEQTLRRHHDIIAGVGLPTTYAGADFATLRATMSVDKKARGTTLRFVVLDALAAPRILTNPPEAVLAEAFDSISNRKAG